MNPVRVSEVEKCSHWEMKADLSSYFLLLTFFFTALVFSFKSIVITILRMCD